MGNGSSKFDIAIGYSLTQRTEIPNTRLMLLMPTYSKGKIKISALVSLGVLDQ